MYYSGFIFAVRCKSGKIFAFFVPTVFKETEDFEKTLT